MLTLLLLTCNSAAHLPRCLDCLKNQTYQNFEIILIDNASQDESLAIARKYQGQFNLQIVEQQQNTGFAAANNLGAKMARGEWLVLLNADAFPQPDWLEKLLQAAQMHPEYTAFSSRQLSAENPEILDEAGDTYHLSGIATRQYVGFPTQEYGLNTQEVFSVCAAAAMYRKDAFIESGGFDEDYFAYYEDVDLGFRLRLLGYRALYVASAVVFHVGSASFGRKSEFTTYHIQRNFVWTYLKNMPAFLFWKYLPAHLLANIYFLTYFSLRNPAQAKAIWKGKIDAIRHTKEILKKRQKIQTKRRIKPDEIEQFLEKGVLTPYIRGRENKITKTKNKLALTLSKPQNLAKSQSPTIKTLGLIITCNPSSEFNRHLDHLHDKFETIVIVDNNSSQDFQFLIQEYEKKHDDLSLILNNKNLGIATALNQGFQWAIEHGYKYVVTLDQDSSPAPGMINSLVQGLEDHPNRENLAVLTPMIVEELLPRLSQYMRRRNKFVYEHASAESGLLRNVTISITSGSLYNLEIWQKLGPFRDDFFIDYVDTEYNLRAIQHGYEISVQCDARLIHNLGKRQEKKLLGKTLYPTFHSPVRWYYISRNRIAMLKMYALKQPHWFFYEMITTIRTFIRAFSLEDHRLQKFNAFLYGTYDGLRGKMGEISPEVKKILEHKTT
jgi:O-antigen biosynthesis protein